MTYGDEHYKVVASKEQAYAAARRGYETQCRIDGREPNWPHFNHIVAALLGNVEDRPHPVDEIQLGPSGEAVRARYQQQEDF